jgi:hypothetical protein
MRQTVLLFALLALSACTTTFEGERPSNLYAQHLDVAVGLYGRWDEKFDMEGKSYYLWRRRVTQDDGDHYCELRLEVSRQLIIARRLMQGYPAACDLFTARLGAAPR